MLIKPRLSRTSLAIYTVLFVLGNCLTPCQAQDKASTGNAPALNGSNTQGNLSPPASTGDAFNVNNQALWNPNISNMAGWQVDQIATGFSQSLPSDQLALRSILGSLTQRYLDKTSHANQSEQALFWAYWGKAMEKLHNSMMDVVSKRLTPDEICDKLLQTPEFKCVLAWNNVLQAMRAMSSTASGSAQYSQRKAEVTKALAQTKQTCLCVTSSAQPNQLPPAAPQRPTSIPTAAPPLKGSVSDSAPTSQPSAKDRGTPATPQSAITTQPPLVLKGKIVSETHFQKVKSVVDKLPIKIQEFLRKHNTKIIATDTLVSQHPEFAGFRPRGWGPQQHWENSDGMYYEPDNEVLVAARYFEGNQWLKAPRIESVIGHEIGHTFNNFMGDFSHKNKEFVDTYTQELKMIPSSLSKDLNYVTQDQGAGQEELFSELFATIYGGAAGGAREQKLIETYFPKTLKVLKKSLDSLR
jgi:hypothetical protein